MNPAVVALYIDAHRKYTSERCRELARYGLYESPGDGYYRLKDTDRDYLDEVLDASEL